MSGEQTRKARTVYVITDARPRERLVWRLAALARATVPVAAIAVPLWALASIPFGWLLGWPPFALFCVGVIASPALLHLTDLAAARLGLPPLAWIASRALRRAESEETRHG